MYQPSLLNTADDNTVKLPSNKEQWQAVRDKAVPGDGSYYAYNKDGVRELIGGPGSTSPSQVPIQFEDEGINLGTIGTVNEVDIVGAGVTASRVGDKVTINIPGGGGPATSQLLANAVFVDAVNGSDIGGAKYTLMDAVNNGPVHKFQTITAALAVAIAGDVLIIYPGEYIENSNLWKNGVQYYFYPGANVTRNDGGDIFSTDVADSILRVYGNGNFTSIGRVIFAYNNSNLEFFGNDLVANDQTVLIIEGVQYIEVHNIISNNANSIHAEGGGVVLDSQCIIKANIIQNFSVAFSGTSKETINVSDLGSGSGYSGTITIYCDKVIGSPNWFIFNGYDVIRLVNQNAYQLNFNLFARQIIYTGAGPISPNDSAVRGLIGLSSSGLLTANITADLICGPQVGIAPRFSDSTTILNYKGTVYGEDNPAFWSAIGNGSRSNLDGKFISSNPTVGIGTIRLATNEIVEIDGKIYNLSATGPGISKELLGSLLILNVVKIVTGGGDSMTSPVLANTYVGTEAVASNTARINMTNVILAGPVDYVDALVQ